MTEEFFHKNDTVDWQEENEVSPHVAESMRSLERRYGTGPFSVNDLFPVPGGLRREAGHDQWLELRNARGEILPAVNGRKQPTRISGAYFRILASAA